jgi:peptidoglycan/xylan/chitin deacetylase (PgdA/CDA1 family)
MRMNQNVCARREFLAATAAAAGAVALGSHAPAAGDDRALIAITLDLEMSRNFPRWEDTHWDYEKGNLDDATRHYAVGVAKRVKERGGIAHFFLVGRALEQPDAGWLQELIAAGHPIGNHTYDHVNVLATKPADVQFRFQRAPWLIEGQPVPEVIRENIRLTSAAMQTRLGTWPVGFRTPGGFADGLVARPDIQKMLIDLGFKWVSAKYPGHAISKPGEEPTPEVFDSIVKAQAAAQPFAYPSGLVEVPMSPISDIGAFRSGRWKLDHFLEAIRRAVAWAIEHRAVFDFLAHPSCLGVIDPGFRAVDLICEMVAKAGDRAALVDLETIARRVQPAR